MSNAAVRTQTVIRLPEELYARVKRKARQEHRSFNSYVEEVLDKATELKFPKLGPDSQISEIISSMSGSVPHHTFTKEELDEDPKLAYLVEKYNL
jgi:hypothetical protein